METEKRIENEANKFVLIEGNHIFGLSKQECYISGAKSERNKTVEEAIDLLMYKADLFKIFRDDDWEVFNEEIRSRLNSLKL